MAVVPMWRLFAYMDDDDGSMDERRTVPEWMLQDVIRWCVTRGFDNIYLDRADTTAVFERKRIPASLIVHSGGLCADSEGSVA